MAKTRTDTTRERRQTLEDAALALFLERGFHAVGLRDLAAVAGVSLGNIYNHYKGKDELFAALVERLYAEFAASTEIPTFLATCKLPDDIVRFGKVLDGMVERHEAYLKLVYIDIAEFQGVHVRPHYEQLAARFRAAIPAHGHSLPAWADPGVVLACVYLQYSTHFVIERMVGAKGYLGLSKTRSIEAIAEIYSLGLAPRTKEKP
jgi:AcrR family transcriptional regulator